MKNVSKARVIFLSIFLFLTILHAKDVIVGVKEGVLLCVYTIIPSLFPFLVLTNMIHPLLLGHKIPLLNHLGSIMGIPIGAESIFFLGALGGYPIGARIISEAYRHGELNQTHSRRLLGFCSNAGPAFIFGIVGTLFQQKYIPWIIWGIHILSAIIVAMILPGKSRCFCQISKKETNTFLSSVEQSIRVLAKICSLITLFRAILYICQKWFKRMLSNTVWIIFSGFLELSNGCLSLSMITCDGERFIIAIVMLSVGGLCVGMQTKSITGSLGIGYYIPGKLLQTMIGALLAYMIQFIIFPKNQVVIIPFYGIILCVCIMLIIYWYIMKKHVAFSEQIMYNDYKPRKGSAVCCFEKNYPSRAVTACMEHK